MRAAVYLRVSTDKQDVRNSVARQLAACRTWAAAHGGEILEDHVYRDEAISGSSMARPGLQRILRILKGKAAPPFDAVLVDDSSRLDRGGRLAELVRVFADRDVQLIAVDSGRDLTAEDEELLVHVKAGLDSHYLREIARRTRAGLAQRALKGLWTGGTVYGYKFIRTLEGTKIEIEPIWAKVVCEIYRRRLNAEGYRHIAIALNATDHPSPRGRAWDATCVRSILKNPKYKGDWTWNVRHWKKRSAGSVFDGERVPRRPRLRPEAEQIRVVREDLRIIDDATWDAVAATFHTKNPGKRPTASPLAGLALCACGGSIVRSGGPGRLCCGWARNRGPSVCTNKRTMAEAEVIRSIVEYLKVTVLTPEMVKATTAEVIRRVRLANARRSTANAEDEAKARIAQTEARLARLVRVLSDGVDSPTVRRAVAEQEAKLHLARQALQTLQLSPSLVVPVDAATIRQRVKETVEGLTGSPKALRAALRTIVAEVMVWPSEDGWRLKVTTRPWVLGAGGEVLPQGGSGGPFTHIGYHVGSILARSVGRGRIRTA